MRRGRSLGDQVEEIEKLLDRYENHGHDGIDLSDAARLLQDLPWRMIVDPHRALVAARLGWLMNDISVTLHDPRILDWAIQLMRREQSMLDPMMDLAGDIRIAGALGALLSERFYVGHNFEDATAVLDLLGQRTDLLRQIPSIVDARTACMFWWTLGRATLDQADDTRMLEHHQAAVEYYDRALELADGGSILETQIEVGRCQAATGLSSRMALGGDDSLVASTRDSNIAAMTRATARNDVADDQRWSWFENLANSLVDRYSATEEPDPADLVAAQSAVDQGLALVDGDGPDAVPLLGTRARAMRARDALAQETLDATFDALRAAARHRHRLALRFGINAVSLLSRDHQWQRAAEAGDLALSVLSDLLQRHVAEEYHRILLRECDTLAVATAYAWHRCGEPGNAVRTAEDNRATLWANRYVEPREVVSRLREKGELGVAADYLEHLRIVRDPTVRDETLRQSQDAIDSLTPHLEPLRSAGHSPRTAAAAIGGGSVYVLPALQGGVALVVYAQGAASSVDLPELSAHEAARLGTVFRRRVVEADNPPNLRIRTVAATVERLDQVLHQPLDDSGACPARAVMIPVGHLTGLPVHARPLGPTDAFRSTVPSLLMASAASRAERRPLSRVLVMPDLSEEGQVPGVQAEVEAILRAFPDAKVLSHDTSADEVIRLAGEHDIVHFACHGVSDDASPVNSRLQIRAGESIRLGDFLLADLDSAPVVVLSACQTAVHGTEVPDESQSLASGLLAVGASSVVASLWPVPGIATAALMAELYGLLAHGEGPATALLRAQRRMAEGTVIDPRHEEDWRNAYYWAGFVHLGGWE